MHVSWAALFKRTFHCSPDQDAFSKERSVVVPSGHELEKVLLDTVSRHR